LPKIVTKLAEIQDGDPGSEKNLSCRPVTGVNTTPDPGSATLLITNAKG
jgi:hypothetical protein